METSSSHLGQKIKRYRLINDIRQEDMAEKMGVSRATLINYEKGHTAINMDVLSRLKNHYPDFESDTKENLKPKIITGNNQMDEAVDIRKDDKANRPIIVKVTGLALYLSTIPPRTSIKVAEEKVPIAYIEPQRE